MKLVEKNLLCMNQIYNNLCDEESKRTFEARLDYLINGNDNVFLDLIKEYDKEIYSPDLDKFEVEFGMGKDYILFGASAEGKKTKEILERSHRNVIAWCDNNRRLWGEEVEGKRVISPREFLREYKHMPVIITTRYHMLEVYSQLVTKGVPRRNIMIPQNGRFLLGFVGNQYFDVLPPTSNKEIFLDVGCYTGDNTIDFLEWCGGRYKKVYAFEPNEMAWDKCENVFRENKVKDVYFIKKGVWSEETVLSFENGGGGACFNSESNSDVVHLSVTNIDNVVGEDEAVTFIKMDIEGSELKALVGAKETIKRCKPKLAICIYHKQQDLWELGSYILELHSDYKFYMRHYSTCDYETVLYAI